VRQVEEQAIRKALIAAVDEAKAVVDLQHSELSNWEMGAEAVELHAAVELLQARIAEAKETHSEEVSLVQGEIRHLKAALQRLSSERDGILASLERVRFGKDSANGGMYTAVLLIAFLPQIALSLVSRAPSTFRKGHASDFERPKSALEMLVAFFWHVVTALKDALMNPGQLIPSVGQNWLHCAHYGVSSYVVVTSCYHLGGSVADNPFIKIRLFATGVGIWSLVCAVNNIGLFVVRLSHTLLPKPLQALVYLASFVSVASTLVYIEHSYFSGILCIVTVGAVLELLKIACGYGFLFTAAMTMVKSAVPEHQLVVVKYAIIIGCQAALLMYSGLGTKLVHSLEDMWHLSFAPFLWFQRLGFGHLWLSTNYQWEFAEENWYSMLGSYESLIGRWATDQPSAVGQALSELYEVTGHSLIPFEAAVGVYWLISIIASSLPSLPFNPNVLLQVIHILMHIWIYAFVFSIWMFTMWKWPFLIDVSVCFGFFHADVNLIVRFVADVLFIGVKEATGLVASLVSGLFSLVFIRSRGSSMTKCWSPFLSKLTWELPRKLIFILCVGVTVVPLGLHGGRFAQEVDETMFEQLPANLHKHNFPKEPKLEQFLRGLPHQPTLGDYLSPVDGPLGPVEPNPTDSRFCLSWDVGAGSVSELYRQIASGKVKVVASGSGFSQVKLTITAYEDVKIAFERGLVIQGDWNEQPLVVASFDTIYLSRGRTTSMFLQTYCKLGSMSIPSSSPRQIAKHLWRPVESGILRSQAQVWLYDRHVKPCFKFSTHAFQISYDRWKKSLEAWKTEWDHWEIKRDQAKATLTIATEKWSVKYTEELVAARAKFASALVKWRKQITTLSTQRLSWRRNHEAGTNGRIVSELTDLMNGLAALPRTVSNAMLWYPLATTTVFVTLGLCFASLGFNHISAGLGAAAWLLFGLIWWTEHFHPTRQLVAVQGEDQGGEESTAGTHAVATAALISSVFLIMAEIPISLAQSAFGAGLFVATTWVYGWLSDDFLLAGPNFHFGSFDAVLPGNNNTGGGETVFDTWVVQTMIRKWVENADSLIENLQTNLGLGLSYVVMYILTNWFASRIRSS
jgi:hypothetical protein